MKYIALIVSFLFLIFTGCAKPENQKVLSFEGGRKLDVRYELSENKAGEKIFLLDYTNPEVVLELERVEKDVTRIWDNLKSEAERLETEEAVIKYGFTTDPVDVEGERHFEFLLFTADRAENGKWIIKRAN